MPVEEFLNTFIFMKPIHSSRALILRSGKAMLCFILAQDSDQGCTAATKEYDARACLVAFECVCFCEIEHYPSQSRIWF